MLSAVPISAFRATSLFLSSEIAAARLVAYIWKLCSVSRTFRFFSQHRNKSISQPQTRARVPLSARRTHSYSGNPYSMGLAVFFANSFALPIRAAPSIPLLFRRGKVETYDKSIGQVRPEKKAFNGYILLPRTSGFRDDTESTKFPRGEHIQPPFYRRPVVL